MNFTDEMAISVSIPELNLNYDNLEHYLIEIDPKLATFSFLIEKEHEDLYFKSKVKKHKIIIKSDDLTMYDDEAYFNLVHSYAVNLYRVTYIIYHI